LSRATKYVKEKLGNRWTWSLGCDCRVL